MAKLAILLATYQGAPYLSAQLESFAAQSVSDWRLIASDDGSSDGTLEILEGFATKHPVTRLEGPRLGATANFLSLLARAPDAQWTALSDQDDVWLPDRLARGVAALQGLEGPALYCSATEVTDATLGHPSPSRSVPKPPGFRNALLQNIAAGNTILMNRAALDLARRHAPAVMQQVPGLAVHDWWLYQLITGVGGQVIYDPTPTLLYRQHGGNEIGVNRGARAALNRLMFLLSGRYRHWTEANLTAFQIAWEDLTPEVQRIVQDFAALRRMPLIPRLRAFRRLRLYRQTRVAQLTMWLGVLLGKI